MKCPNCNVNLLMTERNGVQIDYCPDCRGIWLEKGKLDTILEKAAPAESRSRYNDRYHHYDDEHHGHSKRRGGWLGQLLD